MKTIKPEESPHTKEELFEHFMTYTGYHVIAHDSIKEKLRRAYYDGMEAGSRIVSEPGNSQHLEKEVVREMIKPKKECDCWGICDCSDTRKKEPKKQTLLQWLAYQNCGKTSPLTDREHYLFELLGKYLRYIDSGK